MNRILKHSFVLLFIFQGNGLTSQTNSGSGYAVIDSLLHLIKIQKNDTNKIKTYLKLADFYSYKNPDSAIMFSTLAKEISLTLKNDDFLIKSYGELGWDYYAKGEYDLALKNYFHSLAVAKKKKNKWQIANRCSGIGSVFEKKGNYPKALEYALKALKIDEEINDTTGFASDYFNLGGIYRLQNQDEEALNYYLKALQYEKALDRNLVGSIHGNIGNVYWDMKDYSKSLTYYQYALKVLKETGNKHVASTVLGNIGLVYTDMNENNLALEYYFKSLEMDKELGNKNGIGRNFGNLGMHYLKAGKLQIAENYLKKAITISTEIGSLAYIRDQAKALSELYDTTHKYELAIKYYKKYIEVRDSITNEENTKAQARTEMQYEFDKQQTADSIQTAERSKQEKIKHKQEIAQQKIYTYGGIIGFGLMLIVAFVSFRAFRNKQKANLIIQQQKELVEMKQIEIIDSIKYASRIQKALLPSNNYISTEIKRLNGKM